MLNIIKISFVSIAFLFINGCEQKVDTKIAEQKEKETLIQTGEVSDGAILYKNELQEYCKISGYSLARKNSKQEWLELAKNGQIADEIKKICPAINYNPNWTPDLYEFFHKNAPLTTATTSSPVEYQASYQQQ